MWWIRDFQEGEFIPCNTAQLIAKCPPNAFCFLVKESKNKNILLVLKNFWWLLKAIVAFKKATGTCLIGKKIAAKDSFKFVLRKGEQIFLRHVCSECCGQNHRNKLVK